MKLIKQSYEILEQSSGIDGCLKLIEIAGRTCYKSEDKITKDSYVGFVDRMIKLEHCYTGDTEILTVTGWKKFKDYNNEKVATVNLDGTFNKFESPIRVIHKSYKGNYYKYPTIGLEVTDGHTMYGMFADKSSERYQNFTGSKFTCNTLYKDANNKEKTLGERWFKTISSCIYTPNLLPNFQLIGFWLGDGCQHSGKNTLTFHLKKQRKVEYLKNICTSLGLDWKYKNYYFYIFKQDIGDYFRATYTLNKIKYITPNLCNQDEIYSVIDGLINSDGSIQKTGCSFANTSDYLIDFILNRGCLVGYNVIEGKNSKKGVRRVFLLKRNENINNDSRKPNSKVIITNKEDDVYCVTVSTGLILVRGSNGVISICGNCAMLEHGTVYLKIPIEEYEKNYKNKYFPQK